MKKYMGSYEGSEIYLDSDKPGHKPIMGLITSQADELERLNSRDPVIDAAMLRLRAKEG